MRQVVNLSLPRGLTKSIDEIVKKENYSTRSEFFRDLLRMWLEGRILRDLVESRKELQEGRGKTLNSLEDLR